MSIRRVVPNITSDRLEDSRAFYVELFGFHVAMDLGWMVTLVSPNQPVAQISIVRGERWDGSQQQVTLSIEVADVDEIHAKAVSRGDRIVYPLTDEPWGVRRFHTMDPNGVILNVMRHLG